MTHLDARLVCEIYLGLVVQPLWNIRCNQQLSLNSHLSGILEVFPDADALTGRWHVFAKANLDGVVELG